MAREQALGAVSGWVERIQASGDPALSLRDDAIQDTVRLIQLIDGGPPDPEALLAVGWMFWYQHLARDNDDDGKLTWAVEAFAPGFVTGAAPLPEPLLPSLADAVTGAVRSLVAQAATSDDPDQVAATVALTRRVLAATPALTKTTRAG